MKIPFKFLYIISILMIFAISSLGDAERYPLSTWGEVKDKSHAFVFKLDLRQLVYRESLSLDEFVINDEITQLYFKVLNFPSNVSTISFSVTLTSPQGARMYSSSQIYIERNGASYIDYSPNVILNESGTWYLEIFLEIYPNSTTHHNIISIWRYIGEESELEHDGKIVHLTNTSISKYPAVLSIRWGAIVYTISEYAQIRAARASEEAAIQQSETAEANKHLVIVQIVAVIITAFMAGFTAFMAFSTRQNTKFTQMSIEELRKERRRRSIIKMVAVIDGGVKELECIEGKINHIKNQKKLVELPQPEYIDALSIEYWQDFKHFHKDEFELIKECRDKIKNYIQDREKCKKEIIEILKDKWNKNQIKKIKMYLEELVEKEEWKIGADSVFEDWVPDLADSVLIKEGCGSTRKLYEKFREELEKIREETPVKDKIEQLLKIAKDISKYISLKKRLKKIKQDLQHDYDIMESELAENKQKIEEEIKKLVTPFIRRY